MTNFKKVAADLSRTQQVTQLNDNDQILEGRVSEQEFSNNELDQIYGDLGVERQYRRRIALGHASSDYSSWAHYKAEAGYSIWSYPASDFADASSNLMFMDDVKFVYKGEADSLSIDTFIKAINVFQGTEYDVTTEAGTEGGTAFSFLQLYDGSTTYLLLCGGSKFTAIDFGIETVGNNYQLGLQYWNGSTWVDWDGSCTLSGYTDNTAELTSDGRIEFLQPSDWAEYNIDGSTGYWVKVRTTDTPTQVCQAFHILPGDSVPSLLSLSGTQVKDKSWAWCYYDGKIYCTLPSEGDPYYEGNLFIKSTSSVENRQNFFVNNHLLKISHLRASYAFGTFSPTSLRLQRWTTATRPASPQEARIGWNTDTDRVEVWDGATWTIKADLSDIEAMNSFIELTDTPDTYEGAANYIVSVKSDCSGLEFRRVPELSNEFIGLDDTPTSYSGQANKIVSVKSDQTGLEFVNSPEMMNQFIELHDTPSSYSGKATNLVQVNDGSTGLQFIPINMVGSCTFLALIDTPDSYSGQSGRAVLVKMDESGLEFGAGGKAYFTKVVGFTQDCDFICDGTCDNIQIQQAIDSVTSGGIIILREGSYDLQGKIIISGNNIKIEGQGEASILNLNYVPSSDGNIYVTGTDIGFSKIYIHVVNCSSAYYAVNMQGLNASVLDCKIDGSLGSNLLYHFHMKHGIFTRNHMVCSTTGDSRWECIFGYTRNGSADGLTTIISDNCFENTGGQIGVGSICIWGSIYYKITNNIFRGLYIYGGEEEGYWSTQYYSGNTFDGIGLVHYGIRLGRIVNSVISNNVFKNFPNISDGIHIGGRAVHTIISDNVIELANAFPYDQVCGIHFWLVTGDNNVIENNRVCAYKGIWIDNSSSQNTTIHGNNLEGCAVDLIDTGTDTRKRDNIDKDGAWLSNDDMNQFTELSDCPSTYVGSCSLFVQVKPDQTGLQFVAVPSPTFLSLPDTPSTYVGSSDIFVKVNAAQNALEFGNTTRLDIEITDTAKGYILKSPNGTRWRITIDNSGNLITTSL